MTEILKILERIGISPDEELLFEPISSHAACWEGFGDVETVSDYYEAIQCYIRTVALSFAEKGVKFSSLDGVMISPFAEIGKGTVIFRTFRYVTGLKSGKTVL